jgi:hypothetical protein
MASYSPRKSITFEFQRCNWHCWNHGDGKVKNFIGTLTTEFFFAEFQGCQLHRWNDFRGVINTAEINVTPLKFKETLQVLFLLLKGKSSKNISMANIPILYKYLKHKKVGGCLHLIFGFSGPMTPLKLILATFETIISANMMPYAKRF